MNIYLMTYNLKKKWIALPGDVEEELKRTLGPAWLCELVEQLVVEVEVGRRAAEQIVHHEHVPALYLTVVSEYRKVSQISAFPGSRFNISN